MSLENKIEALTVAVTVLTEVLSRAATAPTAEVLERAADIVTDVVEKAKAPKARTAQAVAASQPSETVAVSPASAPSDTPPEPVSYEAVKQSLIAVSEKYGRQLAVDCLARLGVAKAMDLDPSRFASAVALFDKALETGRV